MSLNHEMGATHTFKDFPAIVMPSFLCKLGFEDLSYHNDASARAELALGKVSLVCWVSEDNPEDREYPDQAKYYMSICMRDEDGYADPSQEIATASFDDPIRAMLYCNSVIDTFNFRTME